MILALSVVSAFTFSGNPANIDHNAGSFAFNVNLSAGESNVLMSSGFGSVESFSPSSIGANGSVIVNFNSSIPFGEMKIELTNGTDNQSFTTNVEYNYCNFSGNGLDIRDFEIKNKGFGNDDEWHYLDEIELIVKVENRISEDIEDVIGEIIIFNEDGVDVTEYFDLEDDGEIDFRDINEDKTKEKSFIIESVPIEDLPQGNYRFYIKVYSDDGNRCTQDIDGDPYFDFDIDNELDDHLLVDETEEFYASCGDSDVSVNFDVWNIEGSEEDEILVNLYSGALGIDEYFFIDGLNEYEEENVNFVFDMPDYVSKEYYNLDVLLSYNYDNDEGDEYDENAYDDEIEDSFQIKLNVISCSIPEPTVSNADTDDEIKIGDEISFTVDVKNNAPDRQNIIVTVENVDSWAELISVEPGIVTLNGGESETVTVILKPTEEGKHTFNIKTQLGVDSYSQAVSVEVPSKWAMKKYFTKEYVAYWVAIALVILILIVLISIIVVMRK